MPCKILQNPDEFTNLVRMTSQTYHSIDPKV